MFEQSSNPNQRVFSWNKTKDQLLQSPEEDQINETAISSNIFLSNSEIATPENLRQNELIPFNHVESASDDESVSKLNQSPENSFNNSRSENLNPSLLSNKVLNPLETIKQSLLLLSENRVKSNFFSLSNSHIPFPDHFSGLKNPSNFCYLNSYLQVLYQIPIFHKMILNHKFMNQCGPIALSLQNLFQKMKQSLKPISSFQVITSFGWASHQIESQQDVHEFSTIFLANL
jgi:ubiquitin C-terminal hydrolase